MAYEVTATRRRPQKFEDLLGQDFVVATLQSAIQSNRIAHAYLFSGPRGCGKTSSARILAKALNCEKGPTPTPCGECPSCQEITKGSCLDVIEIDGASNTSVNDIRQIKDEILFPPNSSRYKIYIIDEVHMLSTSAFNALLKTIEEPPPYVIFIFATTEIHKVPATIKSRCQQFNFRLASIESIQKLLEDSCKEMNITAESEALLWIAREATGSYRDAYTLFDQVAAFSGNSITYDKIKTKLGLVGLDSINQLVDACVNGEVGNALKTSSDLLDQGVSIEQFVTDLSDFFRSLLFISVGITKESILGHPVEKFSENARKTWSSIQLERGLSLLLNLFRDLRYTLNPRYELDITISRLAWLSKYVSPAEVKKAIDQARVLLKGGTPQNIEESPHPFLDSSSDTNQFRGTQTPLNETDSQDFINTDDKNASEEDIATIFSQLKEKLSGKSSSEEEKKETSQEQALHQDLENSTTSENAPSQEKFSSQETSPLQENQSLAENTVPVKKEPLTLEDLKQTLFDVLQDENQILLATLKNSKEWILNSNNLFIKTSTAFEESLIFKERITLQSIIFDKTGLTVTIEAKTEKEKEEKQEAVFLPESVQMIQTLFKGTIKQVVSVEKNINSISKNNFQGEEIDESI